MSDGGVASSSSGNAIDGGFGAAGEATGTATPLKARVGLSTVRFHRDWLLGAMLLLAVFAAYSPVRHAGFIWDDDVMVSRNQAVQSADGLRTIWLTTQLPDYFPLTSSVLWLEWRLWPNSPLGYHLVTVLFHAISAVLLWRVLRRLVVPGAWLAAAIFALHPVNAESIAWIAEHKNTLAMLLYLTALLWYLRFEDTGYRGWYAGAMLAFIGALLSKTAVVPFGGVLLLMAWWRRGRIDRRDVARSVPFLAAALGFALVTIWFQSHRAIGGAPVRTDGIASRIAIAGDAIWFYLYKALLPVDLSFVYPRWSYAIAGLRRFVPLAVVVVSVAGLWWYRRRPIARAALLGTGYFLALLFPVLGFVNIGFMRFSFVADRWQYFAILAPIVGVAAALTVALRSAGAARWQPLVAASIVATLGLLTWARSGLFTDNETLWRATLAKNPQSLVAHTELGVCLCERGKVEDGVSQYLAALTLDPAYESAQYNLGYALLQSGKVEESIPHLEKAIALQADFMPAHHHLGRALVLRGDLDGARTHFAKAIELSPTFGEAHYQLANVFLRQGRLDDAIAQFERALALDPNDAAALNDLAVARYRTGQVAAAFELFQRALKLVPDFGEAHHNYATALLQSGQFAAAVVHYRAVLAKEPNNVETLATLSWILATCPDAVVRNGAQAVELARRAGDRSAGQDAMVLRSLAAAYAEAGNFDAAVESALQAQKSDLGRTDRGFAAAVAAELRLYRARQPMRDLGGGSK